MSKYTTGETAKLCGISVSTVQYYDTRGLLTPSEFTEGGRRIYSEDDFKKMKIICFLRSTGISIKNIGELLSENDPGRVMSVLLQQQEKILKQEIYERKIKLDMLDGIKRELKIIERFSIESIGDIAYVLEKKKKMKKMHIMLLITGIPVGIIQWVSVILWIVTGVWQPFLFYALIAVSYAVWVTIFYLKKVVYICPQCHQVFKPKIKEVCFARHTFSLRKLTCTCCGYKGFCVETYREEKKKR